MIAFAVAPALITASGWASSSPSSMSDRTFLAHLRAALPTGKNARSSMLPSLNVSLMIAWYSARILAGSRPASATILSTYAQISRWVRRRP